MLSIGAKIVHNRATIQQKICQNTPVIVIFLHWEDSWGVRRCFIFLNIFKASGCCNVVHGSAPCLFMPTPPQTRLKIAVLLFMPKPGSRLPSCYLWQPCKSRHSLCRILPPSARLPLPFPTDPLPLHIPATSFFRHHNKCCRCRCVHCHRLHCCSLPSGTALLFSPPLPFLPLSLP